MYVKEPFYLLSNDAVYEFAHEELPKYINSLIKSPVKALEDIIKFNEAHSELTMPPRKFVVDIATQKY